MVQSNLLLWLVSCLCSGASHMDEISGLVQTHSSADFSLGIQTEDKETRLMQLDHMLKNMEISSSDIQQSEVDTISALVSTLEDEFIPALKDQSVSDQAEWTAAALKYSGCFAHLQKRFQSPHGDVYLSQIKIGNAKGKFEKCLLAEASCKAYKQTATNVGASAWSSMVTSSICPESTTCLTDLKAYVDQLDIGPWGQADTCDDDEEKHQQLYCDSMTAEVSACLAFGDCKTDLLLVQLEADIEVRITSRKNIHMVINKIGCRLTKLKTLFTPSANTSQVKSIDVNFTCDTVAEVDTTNNNVSLAVTYGLDLSTPTDATDHCPTPSFHPPQGDCSAWLAGEWGTTDGKSCRHTCSEPTSVGTAPGLERAGCTDTHPDTSICSFYARHHDACGLYADDAEANCCGCGGGLMPTTTTSTIVASCVGGGVDRFDRCWYLSALDASCQTTCEAVGLHYEVFCAPFEDPMMPRLVPNAQPPVHKREGSGVGPEGYHPNDVAHKFYTASCSVGGTSRHCAHNGGPQCVAPGWPTFKDYRLQLACPCAKTA